MMITAAARKEFFGHDYMAVSTKDGFHVGRRDVTDPVRTLTGLQATAARCYVETNCTTRDSIERYLRTLAL